METPRHDHSQPNQHGHSGGGGVAQPGTAIDPICGMTVDIATAKHTHAFGGSTWYFCSKHCVDKFAAEPLKHFRDPSSVSPGSIMPKFPLNEQELNELTSYMLSLKRPTI